MLERVLLPVAVLLMSAAAVWLEGSTAPLARYIEQGFVALALVLLVPHLTSWLK